MLTFEELRKARIEKPEMGQEYTDARILLRAIINEMRAIRNKQKTAIEQGDKDDPERNSPIRLSARCAAKVMAVCKDEIAKLLKKTNNDVHPLKDLKNLTQQQLSAVFSKLKEVEASQEMELASI